MSLKIPCIHAQRRLKLLVTMHFPTEQEKKKNADQKNK